jgi:ribosomal protein S27E
MSVERRSDRLQVRCPNCRESCDVTAENSTGEIRCASCGQSFRRALQETRNYMPHGRLQVRCPNCHESCELTGADSTCEIRCDSCATRFSLAPEATKSYVPRQEMIGQFELLDHLGSGAFGNVWRAKDTILDRQVALKVARSDRFDRSDADVFFREARAAAQLKHPNIVSVHEVRSRRRAVIHRQRSDQRRGPERSSLEPAFFGTRSRGTLREDC